jgi:hypothetical protein
MNIFIQNFGLVEDTLGIGYFGVDGEVLHSSGLECGSVKGIYKHRHETLACSEARSLLYEMFTSSTFINQFIANMLN